MKQILSSDHLANVVIHGYTKHCRRIVLIKAEHS